MHANTKRFASSYNAALFTVSKSISTNAQVAFFHGNTIRITKTENVVYHPEIRSLELTGDFAASICEYNNLETAEILQFLALPKLQTLSIAVGTLAEYSQSVRSFVGIDRCWASFGCIDIGVFELKLASAWTAKFLEQAANTASPRIYLRIYELVEMLPEARQLAKTCDALSLSGWTDSNTKMFLRRQAGCEHVVPYDLAFWLRCYEDWRCLRSHSTEHNLTPWEVENAEEFQDEDLLKMEGVPAMNALLPQGTRLADLSEAEGHSAELLEWATELIWINLWTRMEGDNDLVDGGLPEYDGQGA